ncbi:MAG: hypothetical protein AB7Q16_05515 [Vicinamibacterales bacterium]
MPSLRLTPPQATRHWAVSLALARGLLDALADACFSVRRDDGSYARWLN